MNADIHDIFQLALTAIVVIGSAIGTVYKVVAKIDEISQTLKHHCSACVERHQALDSDIKKLDGRLIHVEKDVESINLSLTEHRIRTQHKT